MSIKYTRMITTESGDIYDFGVRHDSDFQNLEAYTYSNADRLDIAYNYAYDAYNNSLTNAAHIENNYNEYQNAYTYLCEVNAQQDSHVDYVEATLNSTIVETAAELNTNISHNAANIEDLTSIVNEHTASINTLSDQMIYAEDNIVSLQEKTEAIDEEIYNFKLDNSAEHGEMLTYMHNLADDKLSRYYDSEGEGAHNIMHTNIDLNSHNLLNFSGVTNNIDNKLTDIVLVSDNVISVTKDAELNVEEKGHVHELTSEDVTINGDLHACGKTEGGDETEARGDYSHSEGVETVSEGHASHAEGLITVSKGDYSHAEGASTIAAGSCSHAEGSGSDESFTTTIRRLTPEERTIFENYGLQINYFTEYIDEFVNVGMFNVYDASDPSIFVGKAYYNMSNKNTWGQALTELGSTGYWIYIGGVETEPVDGEYLFTRVSGAYGSMSHTEGTSTITDGLGSHAEGNITSAVGAYSHSTGNRTITASDYSTTEGYQSITLGEYSHAEGKDSIAVGTYSHAEGSCGMSIGTYSHAEGIDTKAFGEFSHAEGMGSQTYEQGSHAEGNSIAYAPGSHAEGNKTETNTSAAFSHAEGFATTTYGSMSHAEGRKTTTQQNAFWSHAEGSGTTTVGQWSHAEGLGTTTEGRGAHAEGFTTTAASDYSHSEGRSIIKVTGNDVGDDETLIINVSKNTVQLLTNEKKERISEIYGIDVDFVQGTNALADSQLYKIYSVTTTGVETYLCDMTYSVFDQLHLYSGFVGALFNVTNNAKLNSAINNEQVETFKFVPIQGANGEYSHIEGTNTLTKAIASHAEGNGGVAAGDVSHAEGNHCIAAGIISHAEGNATSANAQASHAEGACTFASGMYSHTEGRDTITKNIASHAEGRRTRAYGNYSHAEGEGSLAYAQASHAEGLETIATGDYSHTEGHATKTNNLYSHAEGEGSIAYAQASHAEGYYSSTYATNSHAEGEGSSTHAQASHAEGYYSSTYAVNSHAEGEGSTTYGDNSHAEGYCTTAAGNASHAAGLLSSSVGEGSHTEGKITAAIGDYSHAEGSNTKAVGHGSHVEGGSLNLDEDRMYIQSSNIRTFSFENNENEAYLQVRFTTNDLIDEYKDYISLYVQYDEKGSGKYYLIDKVEKVASDKYKFYANLHAHKGGFTEVSSIQQLQLVYTVNLANGENSHVEGWYNTAEDYYSHAEGSLNIVRSQSGHIEGSHNFISHMTTGEGHVEGYMNGDYIRRAHVEGSHNGAFGLDSHAEGGNDYPIAVLCRVVYVNENTLEFKLKVLDENVYNDIVGGANPIWKEYPNEIFYNKVYYYNQEGKADENQFVGIYNRLTESHFDDDFTSISFTAVKTKIDLNNVHNLKEGSLVILANSYRGAIGKCSHVEGSNNLASGSDSHAEGNNVIASGHATHAEGEQTEANGYYSHVEGFKSKATSRSAHAEGEETKATGKYSHAEGYQSTSYGGVAGHVEGYKTISRFNAGHAEGWQCISNADYAHAEGYQTESSGPASHTEGKETKTTGDFAHAEGLQTEASGYITHAEGFKSKASSRSAHAEGEETEATGDYSHAEGFKSKASSRSAHAEGEETEATGKYSHAAGDHTIADKDAMTVVGKYNKTGISNALFVVGNGTSTGAGRSNILEVTANGVKINGRLDVSSLSVGGTVISANPIKPGNDKLLSSERTTEISSPSESNVARRSTRTENQENIVPDNTFSDIRKKNVISDISLEKAYDMIDKCQTILYTLKDDPMQREQIGLIAQEVREFFPEIVREDHEGFLSLDYARITVVLLKVMKNLIDRISKLERE